MKKILVLGAGMVSRPLVTWLLNHNYKLTLADLNKSKAEAILNVHPNSVAVSLDVKNEDDLNLLISESDLVISLLPATMHLQVAKFCIKHRTSLVTTSYQHPGMAELQTLINDSGIIILNEMGLDPGIDHMSAMSIIDRVHSNQGQVLSFYSLCGALPSLKSADNPMQYKFTWSPLGVMNASLSNAKYLLHGEEVVIPSEKLFSDTFKVDFPEIGTLDMYPNRDSVSYINEYRIPEVKSMMRGTLRLPGWNLTIDAFKKLGLLDTQTVSLEGLSYFNLIERKTGILYPEYECQIAKFLQIDEKSVAIESLRWLGFFSNEKIGKSADSPFNVTCDLMFGKMMLKESDTDMVLLQHELLVRYPDEREEKIFSRLYEKGDKAGNTAIAKTVALPAAIAAHLILSGEIKLRGLLRPVIPEIYEPVLAELEKAGISVKEEIKSMAHKG
jgi:saccharopine dehydrogenase-like NADP-dependent oxidoreductase